MDYEHTDIFSRILTDFTDFLYNIFPEVVGFTLTLGFASCIRDRTDKTARTDSPTGEGYQAVSGGQLTFFSS